MLSTNDLRTNIIHLVTNIDDVEKLTIIYKNIEAINKPTLPKTFPSKKQPLNLEDGKVQIRKNVSFEDLMKEQNYKEFRRKADKIDWGYSLDELLAAI